MIEIDGRHGEGGGQILRSSLSLSALTGKAFHIVHIRANRKKAGLMRQHLTCVKAVAEITNAELSGAELKSQELFFTPGRIRSGNYHFTVGSAGSVILIAQTVLPVLLHGEGVSKVVIEGGTHVPGAPVYEYFEQIYLPCLRAMGADVNVVLEQAGFYPAGGGRIVLEIHPVKKWQRVEWLERGMVLSGEVVALGHGLPTPIYEDEIRTVLEKTTGEFPQFRSRIQNLDSPGPGNVLYVKIDSEKSSAMFSVCGKTGISRFDVGKRAAKMCMKYLVSNVPVDPFLADQLLLPAAVGADTRFLTTEPSQHTLTNMDVIRQFLDVRIRIENMDQEKYMIGVER
ncbi:MAG: RNA 3'-terminal phosphate cyclase [Lentisphaeria bacterium]|nr:RNA 3'-terminal phosphate cyclase [Lentisphaeria bacterium]